MGAGWWWVLSVLVVCGGCGGDRRTGSEPVTGPEGGVLTFDAAMVPLPDSGAGPADGSASADAGPPHASVDAGVDASIPTEIDVARNIAVSVEQPVPAPGEEEHGIRVTSLAYFQKPPGSIGHYRELFVGLHNFGALAQYQVRATIRAFDSGGSMLFEWGSYVHSGRFLSPSGLAISGIDAGADGAIWTNEIGTSAIPASFLSRVTIELETSLRDDIGTDPDAPVVISAVPVDRFLTGNYGMQGTVRNGDRLNDSIRPRYYIRAPGGWYRDHLYETRVDPLAPNATWDFATLTTDGMIFDYFHVLDYRNAASSVAAVDREDARESMRRADEERRLGEEARQRRMHALGR